MNDKEMPSEEQLDFLREIVNIGAGNAATALSQILQSDVNLKIPTVHVLTVPQIPSILIDPSLPVVCVRMGMVGDIAGELFFIVPNEQKVKLTRLVEWAIPVPKNGGTTIDLSALTEVGNIVAGSYLTAVHDFCKLSIYHTVPTLAIDMVQSLLDESLIALSRQAQVIFAIENEFTVDEHRVRTLFLLIPSAESIKTLVNSIGEARIACTSE